MPLLEGGRGPDDSFSFHWCLVGWLLLLSARRSLEAATSGRTGAGRALRGARRRNSAGERAYVIREGFSARALHWDFQSHVVGHWRVGVLCAVRAPGRAARPLGTGG